MKKRTLYIWIFVVILAAIFTRFAFLGYSTIIHTEAENASNAGVVLACFNDLPPQAGISRLWHIFLNNNNPIMQGIMVNVPAASVFGLNAFSVRLNAAIGGIISLVLAYILVRRRTDDTTALFALVLVSFNPFLIAFHRFGHLDSLQTAFFLGGLIALDTFTLRLKPKISLLVLASLLFALAFLLKYNAIVIVALTLFLYCLIFRLKLRYAVLTLILTCFFPIAIFFNQSDKFFNAMCTSLGYAGVRSDTGNFLSMAITRFKDMGYDTWVLLRGHVFYFEQTVLPLFVSLLFWKKIKNKLFRFMLVFGILYFAYLFLQGRAFYRYFQIGVIAASIAFAFPIRRFAEKRFHYSGTIFLSLFVLWSLLSHVDYISSQYQHVPHYEIVRIATEETPKGNSIILYGRNPETEFYFSEDGTLLYDATKDPHVDDVVLIDKYPDWRSDIKKIRPTVDNLLDPGVVKSGDIVVVTGTQMDGGEPNPKSLGVKLNGMRLWGIREYGHRLEKVKEFKDEYRTNPDLQSNYTIVKEIFLTNGSGELAALILRKK